MTNEIVKVSDFQQTLNYAKAFKESGMFPDIKSEAMAIVKIQAGTELGIGAFAAMQGVDIIQGKCRQNANLQAALIKRSGKYTYKILEHSDKKCRLEFFEIRGNQWEPMGFSEYTIEEAQQAGLASKDIWKKYPKNLLFARTISNGAKWFTPDVFIVGAYNESDEFDYTPVIAVDRSGVEALTTPVQQHHNNDSSKKEEVLEMEEVKLDDLDSMTEAIKESRTSEELKAIAEAIKSYGEMPEAKRTELQELFKVKRKELKDGSISN